jgi:hypothetical protein
MKSFCCVRASILLLLALVGAHLFAVAQEGNSSPEKSRLICGTDESGFNGMDGQLAEVRTDGPSLVSAVQIYNLNVPVNGITFASTFLWAGQPEPVGSVAGNTLQEISVDLPPTVLSTIEPGSNSFSPECCNEQMVSFKGGLYHAHYSDVIQRVIVDSSGNSEVAQTYPQADVVGMASDGDRIWISKWSEEQVGIWDPPSNTFTVVFSTPGEAGGLAWDVERHVLWVGMEGGSVIPYSATGKQLGDAFQPFGSIDGTIDGLALIPATSSD